MLIAEPLAPLPPQKPTSLAPGSETPDLPPATDDVGMPQDRFAWLAIRLLLLIIAIVHQGYSRQLFCGHGYDKVQQVAAARSLLQGHGISLPKYNPNDLSSPTWEPVVGWPPGYSLALAPLLKLDQPTSHALFQLDWISCAVFFLSWFFMFERLRVRMPWHARLTAWIVWGIVFPPLTGMTSSDAMAAAAYSLGLACLMESSVRARVNPLYGVIGGLFLGAAAATRYAYWPLALVPPIVLACMALRRSNRWKLLAVLCAATVLACLGALYVYQTKATGAATYLDKLHPANDRGVFINQLTSLCPFPSGALGVDSAWTRLAERLQLPKALSTSGNWAISCAILSAFIWSAWRLCRREPVYDTLDSADSPAGDQLTGAAPEIAAARDDESLDDEVASDATDPIDGQRFFWACGALTLLTTLAVVAWCTVRYRPIDGWVYAQELRYFAPAFGFLLLGVTNAASAFAQSRAVGACGTALLVMCVLMAGIQRTRHWTKFRANKLPPLENSARYDEEGKRLAELVANQRRSGVVAIVIDDHISRAGVALMEGAVVIDPDAPFDSPEFTFPLATTRSVTVLAPYDRHFWRSRLWGVREGGAASVFDVEIKGEGYRLGGRYVLPLPPGGPNP